jgi:hypothetical protein
MFAKVLEAYGETLDAKEKGAWAAVKTRLDEGEGRSLSSFFGCRLCLLYLCSSEVERQEERHGGLMYVMMILGASIT